MNELLTWAGKSEDISITYDVITSTPLLLQAPVVGSGVYSAGVSRAEKPSEEQGKTLVDIEWDVSVPHADKIDYGIAVGCGLLTGFLDAFLIGKSSSFSIDKANKWGGESINKFVIKIAEIDGMPKGAKGESALKEAVKYLGKNHPMATDQVMHPFGGTLQHHFRDFSHHCSLGGLLCSLVTQFSDGKICIGTDPKGNLKIVSLEDKTFIGKNTHEKIAYGIIEWAFHVVSDMAGSGSTAGKGTGIPGPILSFLKETSTLGVFKNVTIKDTDYRVWLSKLFNGTLLADHDEMDRIIPGTLRRFNLRTEIGLMNQVALQALPVAMNECLVRALYFVRRLYLEIKSLNIQCIGDLQKIEPKDILPTNNPVVLRMMTIASGTFTTVDFADAGIRSLIKHKGNITDPGLWIDFAVHINIVGVGRFVVACVMDAKMVYEQEQAEKRRRRRIVDYYEKELVQLNCMTLTLGQTIALLSMEKLLLEYDIANTKKKKAKNSKQEWMELWKEQVLTGLPVIDDDKEGFFYSKDELQKLYNNELKESDDIHWLYLITLEAEMFHPYYGFGRKDDKKYETLDLEADFLMDIFTKEQPIITKGVLKSYRKAIKRYHKQLSGKSRHKVAHTIGTGLMMVVAGGAAYVAAPVVAPALAAALFGDAVAGLSGAALTSASLALFGGGSLASGGLGMAGGTVAISGGGALIGVLGGSGASVITSASVLSNEGYIYNECTKLLTYCKEVLIDLYRDTSDVDAIRTEIHTRIGELKKQIDTLQEADTKSKKEKKMLFVICKRSIKYLERCERELGRMVEAKVFSIEKEKQGGKDYYRYLINDTEAIVEKGWYRAAGKPVELTLSREEIESALYIPYYDVHRLVRNQDTNEKAVKGSCEYDVMNNDSFTVALREMEADRFLDRGNGRVLVLNFANAFSPGGGVRKGASAQEEDLCRRSTLLFSLESDAAKDFYIHHRDMKTNLASDAMIISPNVEVIRGQDYQLLPESRIVSVLTCAAPDIRHNKTEIADEELEMIFYDRIMGMLHVSVHYGYRFLVLGAFGCGAFGNDATMVAEQFSKALKNIQNEEGGEKCLFDRVVFAVLDRSDNLKKVNAFRRYFDGSSIFKESKEMK